MSFLMVNEIILFEIALMHLIILRSTERKRKRMFIIMPNIFCDFFFILCAPKSVEDKILSASFLHVAILIVL